jgi:hypothetical protein
MFTRTRHVCGAAVLVAASVGFLSASAGQAEAATTVVTPGSLGDWTINNDSSGGPATASVTFQTGPAIPPLGVGSVQLSVGSNGDGAAQLRNAAFAGTKLSDLSALSYYTYVEQTGSGGQAPYIILNIDNDNNGTVDDLLFFEPVYQSAVFFPSNPQPPLLIDVWQQWDARHGGWWSLNGIANAGPGTDVKSLDDYILAEPDATIRNSSTGLGGVRLVAGFGAGAWDNFIGDADAFSISTSSANKTYDFEPGSFGPCAATTSGTTITLLADCTTDHTLTVPNGFTLDGAGHTITAVDPSDGHFLGPIVTNAGTNASVRNVTITASNLVDICDGGADRLRGVLFDHASGSVTNVHVVGVRQDTTSGCQEGNGIEIRNLDSSGNPAPGPRDAVTISNNVVSGYQKNGITANGTVAATITGNSVTGDGPINYIAQNGVQIAFGATAQISGNAVRNNNYTPSSFVACGLLFFQATGVRAQNNVFSGNERDVCNFGKGGGKFNPTP